MLWLLEPDVYAAGLHPLARAVAEAGHQHRAWDDDCWRTRQFPAFDGPVIFHGSLGNAARIRELGVWHPGALCNTAELHCSRWYPTAAKWLVHESFVVTTVRALIAAPANIAGALADSTGEVFVRPDSPLKSFSGRVVKLEGLTPADLDHGFYYEDIDLPIIVAPKQALGAEWRFVVCGGEILAGCRYEASNRSAVVAEVSAKAAALAAAIAGEFVAPDPVYVLDIVESEAGLRMVEINPFSGADLYACDRRAIVMGVARWTTAAALSG